MARERVVFRSAGVLFLVVSLGFLLWSLFALAVIGEGLGLEGVLFLSGLFSLSLWFNLKIGFWRNVSVESGLLVVRGIALKTTVALDRVDRVWASGGELIVELKGGGVVDVPAFQGSLLSSVFGSPSASRAAEGIRERQSSAASEGGGEEEDVSTSLHLSFAYLPLIWMPSFFVYWALSGFVNHL